MCIRDRPDGLYACVDMTKIPVLPLFRFLYEQDMIGADVFPHRFHIVCNSVSVIGDSDHGIPALFFGTYAVSYTHLDVYKRQKFHRPLRRWNLLPHS